MINAERFDLFLGEHEVISGQATINPEISLKKPLVSVVLSDLEKNNFHMLISKNLPYAKELKNLLDDGIEDLQKSGQSQRFLKQYIKAP